MAAGTAYAKRYAGGFVDLPTKTTAIDQAFLNAVEVALLQLIGAAPTVDGQVAQWDNVNTRYGPALLLNKNIDPAAGIVKSKLNLAGANGIVDADVATAAAIARSKLNFGAGLVAGDLAPGAAAGVNAAVTISAANTDLAAPGATVNHWIVTTAGGTLRSIGSAPGGTRITLRNATTGYVRLLNQVGGGGANGQLLIQGGNHKFLAPGQSCEFQHDGTFFWEETNRPAMELICDLVLAGAQASFDTDTILGVAAGIPQVYSHLIVECVLRSDAAVLNQNNLLRFNNDAAANYDHQYTQDANAVITGNSIVGATSIANLLSTGATGTTAFSFLPISMKLPSYRDGVVKKSMIGHIMYDADRSAGNSGNRFISGFWDSQAAISRIQVIAAANNFVANSRFSLYGVT